MGVLLSELGVHVLFFKVNKLLQRKSDKMVLNIYTIFYIVCLFFHNLGCKSWTAIHTIYKSEEITLIFYTYFRTAGILGVEAIITESLKDKLNSNSLS